MTAPQSATPGSDSVRAQIAEVLTRVVGDLLTEREIRYTTKALLPVVDDLRAEAKAEVLEEAGHSFDLPVTAWRPLRARAAAYRTNLSSEETHRG